MMGKKKCVLPYLIIGRTHSFQYYTLVTTWKPASFIWLIKSPPKCMEDLFKDIDTPINVENAAIRHLSQVISELSPEQTQQLLQIVDSVMAIKNEYL